MNIKYIIFDLDGTLIDTAKGIINATAEVISMYNLPSFANKDIQPFIGPPIYYFFKEYYKLTDEESSKVNSLFRETYSEERFLYQAELYESCEEVLRNLKKCGYVLGIATNKRQDYALKLLDYLEITKYFTSVIGSDFNTISNKKEILKKCMLTLGASPDKTIYVGDTETDYEAANSNRVYFIAAKYGYGLSYNSEIKGCKTLKCIEQTILNDLLID